MLLYPLWRVPIRRPLPSLEDDRVVLPGRSLRDPSWLVGTFELAVEPGVVPTQAKTQDGTQKQEAGVDSVSQGIKRLVLSSVNPDTNNLARSGEGNVQTRSDGACRRGANIVRNPGA